MSRNTYIPIDECQDHHLYLLEARTASYGIWRADEKRFETIDEKELHWDSCNVHGTAKPRKMVERAPVFADTNAGNNNKEKYFEKWEQAESTAEGAVFLDIDGTVINWMTGEPVGRAVEMVNSWHRKGVQIILTTRRGFAWPEGSPYTPEATEKLLEKIGLKYDKIVYDIHSPRMVINDEGAEAIHHPASTDWPYPDYPFNSDRSIYHNRPLPFFGIAARLTLGGVRTFYFYTQDMKEAQSCMRTMGYEPMDYEVVRFYVASDSFNPGRRYISLITEAEYRGMLKRRQEKGEE